MLAQSESLARMAHAETGIGRAADKVAKNMLVATKTPGPEDLETTTVTGDQGMMVTEWAPFGVIGAITPTTNPTSTIINNSIAMLSAGNAAVFNVHPNARGVSAENIRLINRAIVAAGGPEDLVTATPDPTIDSAKHLMHHPDVRVLLVTGGPGVVREALKTDKRAVCAGPGNPPAVVDTTADVEKAARDVVNGASFDNNLICTDEKTAIVVDSVADQFVRAMAQHGAYVLKGHELARLERVVFEEMGAPNKPGVINPAWIGKDASRILAEIGVSTDQDIKLVVAEVPKEHSLVWTEQMMPVFPVVRVPNVETAIELGGSLRAWVPPHCLHPFDERRRHHSHGTGDQLLDLRGQRTKLRGSRAWWRRLQLLFDRQSHRRRAHADRAPSRGNVGYRWSAP